MEEEDIQKGDMVKTVTLKNTFGDNWLSRTTHIDRFLNKKFIVEVSLSHICILSNVTQPFNKKDLKKIKSQADRANKF